MENLSAPLSSIETLNLQAVWDAMKTGQHRKIPSLLAQFTVSAIEAVDNGRGIMQVVHVLRQSCLDDLAAETSKLLAKNASKGGALKAEAVESLLLSAEKKRDQGKTQEAVDIAAYGLDLSARGTAQRKWAAILLWTMSPSGALSEELSAKVASTAREEGILQYAFPATKPSLS
jgi:hypothetical protein